MLLLLAVTAPAVDVTVHRPSDLWPSETTVAPLPPTLTVDYRTHRSPLAHSVFAVEPSAGVSAVASSAATAPSDIRNNVTSRRAAYWRRHFVLVLVTRTVRFLRGDSRAVALLPCHHACDLPSRKSRPPNASVTLARVFLDKPSSL